MPPCSARCERAVQIPRLRQRPLLTARWRTPGMLLVAGGARAARMLGSLLRPVRACGPLAGSPWRAVGVSVGRAVLEWSSAGASSGRRVLTMAASLWRAPVLARVAVCGSPPMMTIPDLPPGVAEGGRRGPRRRPPRVRCVRPTERRRRRRSLAGCPSQQRGSRRGSRSTRPPKRHANTCQNTVREMECSALSWGSPSRTMSDVAGAAGAR